MESLKQLSSYSRVTFPSLVLNFCSIFYGIFTRDSRSVVKFILLIDRSLIILVSHVPSLLDQITSQLCKKLYLFDLWSLRNFRLILYYSGLVFFVITTFIDSWNAHKSINDLISDLQLNCHDALNAEPNFLRRWSCNWYLCLGELIFSEEFS